MCKQLSTQTAVEDSKRIFTELLRFIERSYFKLTKLIRDQEKTEMNRAEGVLKRLEQEIIDLKRRETELEQLSYTDNDIHFLQVTDLRKHDSEFTSLLWLLQVRFDRNS